MKTVINCQTNTKRLYQDIARSKYFGESKELDYALIFCIAASIGFKNNSFKQLENKVWIARTEYVEKNFDLKNFVYSIAISHKKSLEALKDVDQIYSIAECYANGGIRELYSLIINDDPQVDFDRVLEKMINDIVKEHKISDE